MPAPTFPDIPPDMSSPGEETKYRTRRNKLGDGYEQAVSDGINSTELTWKLSFDNLDNAAIETIITFLDERAGSKPFLWKAPGTANQPAMLWTCEERSRSDYRPSSSTLRCTFKRWFGAAE